MKLFNCEVIYTFDIGEQTFSESVSLDLQSEKSAKASVKAVLKRHGEGRKIVKASLCVYNCDKTKLPKWVQDVNGKLYWK